MGILVINEYGKDAREFRISQDQVRIGRDPLGEVVLDDLGVSRSHARILRRDRELLIEDLGSRNGTLLNERKLPGKAGCILKDGDSIQVGRSVLRLILRWSRKITTGLRKARRTSRRIEPRSGAAGKPGEPLCLFRLAKLEAALLLVEEGRPAERRPLRSDRVRIGRAETSDLVLSDPTASTDHAEIVYNREGFHLVDRDSSLGTFLDGVAVRVARLPHRGFVKLGRVRALFSVREEGKEPPEASFSLRDRLADRFPDREERIQEAFRDSRERALDFAEELVLRGVLDPEEWWEATSGFSPPPSSAPRAWIARLFRRA